MQIEQYAFISAYEKQHVGELAHAASDAGFNIVSLGGTAKLIEEHGIPVVSSEEFVREDDYFTIDEEEGDPRENRELIAGYLAQHMCQDPKELGELGRRTIDLVYVNLMPPVIHPVTRGYKSDKGGALMLSAALEGNRTVLTEPHQLTPYAEYLGGKPSYKTDETKRLLLADEALRYLELYTTRTRELGRAAVQAAQWARITQS